VLCQLTPKSSVRKKAAVAAENLTNRRGIRTELTCTTMAMHHYFRISIICRLLHNGRLGRGMYF
jgi:hypothetical protein